MILSPGDQLLELCSSARSEVVLVAPFVKVKALERVLEAISKDIPVTCVARWRPEEIAAGVCDLEIFELIEGRKNSRLLLHSLLHAKYFRADESYLVGSANLTLRALGWTTPSNLEILVVPEASDKCLEEFEKELYTGAFRATQEIKDEMFTSVKELQQENRPLIMLSEEAVVDGADNSIEGNPGWTPFCPDPEKLYKIYSGRDKDIIGTANLKAAEADLKVLSLPANLSEKVFNGFVRASLQQMPLIRAICRAAALDPVSQFDGKRLMLEYSEKTNLSYPLSFIGSSLETGSCTS